MTSDCPDCGTTHTVDLEDHYLSYGAHETSFTCESEKEVDGKWVFTGCGTDWTVHFDVEIRLTIREPAVGGVS